MFHVILCRGKKTSPLERGMKGVSQSLHHQNLPFHHQHIPIANSLKRLYYFLSIFEVTTTLQQLLRSHFFLFEKGGFFFISFSI
jgi:hypothetical protein